MQTPPTTAPTTPTLPGFAMPAEWAPHEATILTWPHRPAIWRGVVDAVEETFVQMVWEISGGEQVWVNVPDRARARVEAKLRAGGAWGERVGLLPIDSDDVWARDHGPTIVCEVEGPRRVMIDWRFNAWGGKYDCALDGAVVEALAPRLGLERLVCPLVMEGGALEVNGAGDLLTTESVLLNPNRNPGVSQAALVEALRGLLGVEQVLWLGDGLEGDDTDGHIDDIARFVAPERVVVVAPPPDHPDGAAMAANIARLRSFRASRSGRPFEVLTLPSPAPIRFGDEHLPASYANFYVANRCVLVPVFGQPTDAEALALLRGCFPSREVIGLDCKALVSQYGAIHCVTQQVPQRGAVGAGVGA
jgi:agmatine deiminase